MRLLLENEVHMVTGGWTVRNSLEVVAGGLALVAMGAAAVAAAPLLAAGAIAFGGLAAVGFGMDAAFRAAGYFQQNTGT